MNVDEAISEVNTNIRPNPRIFNPRYYEVAITLADEVERLRVELAVEREAVKSLGNSFDKLRAELAAAKAANVSELNAYRKEVELLRIELGKESKKAASVCPVKFDGVYANSADEAVVWFEETGKAERFADWLRNMNERGEG